MLFPSKKNVIFVFKNKWQKDQKCLKLVLAEQKSKANMDMAMAEEKDPDTGKTRKHIIDEKTGQLDLFGSDV